MQKLTYTISILATAGLGSCSVGGQQAYGMLSSASLNKNDRPNTQFQSNLQHIRNNANVAAFSGNNDIFEEIKEDDPMDEFARLQADDIAAPAVQGNAKLLPLVPIKANVLQQLPPYQGINRSQQFYEHTQYTIIHNPTELVFRQPASAFMRWVNNSNKKAQKSATGKIIKDVSALGQNIKFWYTNKDHLTKQRNYGSFTASGHELLTAFYLTKIAYIATVDLEKFQQEKDRLYCPVDVDYQEVFPIKRDSRAKLCDGMLAVKHHPQEILPSRDLEVLIALRGTEVSVNAEKSTEDLVADLKGKPKLFSIANEEIWLHEGIGKRGEEVFAAIEKSVNLNNVAQAKVTGHSLGGGVANYVAMRLQGDYDIPTKTITFAAPNVLYKDTRLPRQLLRKQNTLSIVAEGDPVPYMGDMTGPMGSVLVLSTNYKKSKSRGPKWGAIHHKLDPSYGLLMKQLLMTDKLNIEEGEEYMNQANKVKAAMGTQAYQEANGDVMQTATTLAKQFSMI